MPGRVSARASRASGADQTVSRKTSAQNLRSIRASTSHRASSSPVVEIPDEGAVTSLRKQIAGIFADSQKSTTGHRKLVINLRKIQEACCYEQTNAKGSQDNRFDEDDFVHEVARCVLRILPIRKSENVGDRVVRFLGVFLRVASDKDNQLAEQDPDHTSLPETPTSRLSTALFSALSHFLHAKDKVIRFRAVQITSHMINTLDTLDDELFHVLRLALLKRIHDKEASVRMHAIYGLTRLAAEVDDESAAEDSDDSDSDAAGVLEKLLIQLQNDPSAEVRRSLLLNLPIVPKTLPYLLERARDQDPATRRALFARLLPALGDFRHLSLTHREKLLRWGLRDRDEAVRKAAARLFRERWIEDCAALPGDGASPTADEEAGPVGQPGEQKKGASTAAAPSMPALLELLERIDVTNSAANGVAIDAMKEFWDGRPDYVAHVTFPDSFWSELTPEAVFVARTFNDFCRGAQKDAREQTKLTDMLEQRMPEVTKFGFLLEREIKLLVESVKAAASGGPDGDGDEDAEEESVSRGFTVEQMLYMALTFDYSDEVGRRKMFGLLRDAVALPELPEEATKLVIEVLRLVCGDDNQGKGEREFCGVVLEAIAEVHDTIMGEDDKDRSDADESFHSARSELSDNNPKAKKRVEKDADGDMSMDDGVEEEKAIREIMVNMKCLHIAQCMLQNVQCDLEANVHLVTMLNNLVVPAVRSQEAPIRERGLVCLGLCCLLGKNLAIENLTLFLHCFAKGHAELQAIAIQILTDILTTHPALLAPAPDQTEADDTSASVGGSSALLKPVLKVFSKALKSEVPEVQSTGATALSKLMLSQLITDADILKQLVVTFFDPETAGNAQLRQALSYFLPVYCHSRYENAARMVQVATGVISKVGALREAFAEDEDAIEGDMVSTGFVGGLLVDWTDPRKIIGQKEQTYMIGGKNDPTDEDANVSTHMLMAEALLERMVTGQTSKEERKVLFSMLSKLHLASPMPASADAVRAVLELIAEATETRLATDATSRNVLTKLQNTLLRLIHDTAGAERGADETGIDLTSVTATPSRRRRTTTGRGGAKHDDDTELLEEYEAEDDPATQLQRELEATRIEDEGERTRLTAIGEEESSVVEAGAEEEYDASQLPDEREMQSLVESLEDDDEDLL